MQSIEVIKGSDTPLSIQILEEDENGIQRPKDLTNATELKVCFPQEGGGFLELDLTSGKINVEVGSGGVFTVDWEESDTLLLKRGQNQSFQVSAVIASKTSIVLFEKVLTVKDALC